MAMAEIQAHSQGILKELINSINDLIEELVTALNELELDYKRKTDIYFNKK
jgi:hypothetical protein